MSAETTGTENLSEHGGGIAYLRAHQQFFERHSEHFQGLGSMPLSRWWSLLFRLAVEDNDSKAFQDFLIAWLRSQDVTVPDSFAVNWDSAPKRGRPPKDSLDALIFYWVYRTGAKPAYHKAASSFYPDCYRENTKRAVDRVYKLCQRFGRRYPEYSRALREEAEADRKGGTQRTAITLPRGAKVPRIMM